MSPDGRVAAVAHAGSVSLVDLETAAVASTWPVGVDQVGDLAVTDIQVLSGPSTRFATLLPVTDQMVPLYAVDLGNGVEGVGVIGGLTQGLFYGGTVRALPKSNRVIASDGVWVDPERMFVVEIGPDAVPMISHYYDAYRGILRWRLLDFRGCQATAMHEGSRLWIGGFLSDGGVAMVPSGYLWWADAPDSPSAAAGRWLIQPRSTYVPNVPDMDTAFLEVDAATLEGAVSTPYPMLGADTNAFPLHGRVVSYDRSGQHRVAAVLIDETAHAPFYVAVLVL